MTKLNQDGVLLWSKDIAIAERDEEFIAFASSVVYQKSTNRIYIAGSDLENGSGYNRNFDLFALCLNLVGDVLWKKTYFDYFGYGGMPLISPAKDSEEAYIAFHGFRVMKLNPIGEVSFVTDQRDFGFSFFKSFEMSDEFGFVISASTYLPGAKKPYNGSFTLGAVNSTLIAFDVDGRFSFQKDSSNYGLSFAKIVNQDVLWFVKGFIGRTGDGFLKKLGRDGVEKWSQNTDEGQNEMGTSFPLLVNDRFYLIGKMAGGFGFKEFSIIDGSNETKYFTNQRPTTFENNTQYIYKINLGTLISTSVGSIPGKIGVRNDCDLGWELSLQHLDDLDMMVAMSQVQY